MDLAAIRTRVQRQFGDESGAQITTADIDRWANDAQLDIIRRTECLQDSDTINSVDGQEEYSLPADFLYARRVTYDGLLVRRSSFEEVDHYFGNRDETVSEGTPRRYWVWNRQLFLHPRPHRSGDTIKLHYVKAAASLANATDVPDIPTSMHEDIVRYCLARAYELDENFDAARRVMGDYEERINMARMEQAHPYADSYPSVRALPGDDY